MLGWACIVTDMPKSYYLLSNAFPAFLRTSIPTYKTQTYLRTMHDGLTTIIPLSPSQHLILINIFPPFITPHLPTFPPPALQAPPFQTNAHRLPSYLSPSSSHVLSPTTYIPYTHIPPHPTTPHPTPPHQSNQSNHDTPRPHRCSSIHHHPAPQRDMARPRANRSVPAIRTRWSGAGGLSGRSRGVVVGGGRCWSGAASWA